MDERAVETIFAACERELAAGTAPDLRASGFWRAVAHVKTQPDLVARHAEQIARIDRGAFRRRHRLVFPLAVGLALVLGGLAIDLGFLAAAPFAGPPWREVLLLVGAAGLAVATHGLAHLVVGAAVGIRFTDWFSEPPLRPQPGFKIDYASYLRTPPRARAWMHASGAIVTKIVPFACAAYGAGIGADAWATWLLLAGGVIGILTDAFYSVKASDWKKFKREMNYTRS